VIPVKKAVDLGADRIFVIRLTPPFPKKTKDKYKRIPNILFRTLDLMLTEIKNNDVDLVKQSNAELIVIEPKEELTENSLKFVPEEMRKMMKKGYNRAKEIFPL
jgi:predicted patatin/cPLA2 family phospholipase